MQRIVQKITQNLIDRLPENDQYYRLDELREWGFPPFILQRIKIELERNLAESMIIPKTDWANTQSDAVLDAWQQFVDAIRAEARLPASYGKTVIETAVDDVVRLLVQPRKQVPEVIFGDDERLSQNELDERLEKVVVYRHFAKLIRRYLQKKEMETLAKEKCRQIVNKADERLTAQYSPLNWAQMLDPLFKLENGELDTNLLRLFFEDRKMPRIARKFDLMNNDISRAGFIETLSSPESLEFDDEEEQSSLFGDQPEQESAESTPEHLAPEVEESEEEWDEPEVPESADVTPPLEDELQPEDVSQDESDNERAENIFSEQEEWETEVEEEEPEEDSLNAIFSREEDREQQAAYAFEEAETEERETEETSREDYLQEEPEEASEPEIEEPQEPAEEDEVPDEEGSDGEEEASPMWMRYMSDEEIEEFRRKQEEDTAEEDYTEEPLVDVTEEEREESEEEGFIEDPIIDLTEEDATDQDIAALKDQLENDRALFVEEIFGGSERAYDEAMEEITSYDSWRDASKFIEKDIFKRNLVDMYSEAAIDFTDQLQNYFTDKQNSN